LFNLQRAVAAGGKTVIVFHFDWIVLMLNAVVDGSAVA
jgi:hypothetical protein